MHTNFQWVASAYIIPLSVRCALWARAVCAQVLVSIHRVVAVRHELGLVAFEEKVQRINFCRLNTVVTHPLDHTRVMHSGVFAYL